MTSCTYLFLPEHKRGGRLQLPITMKMESDRETDDQQRTAEEDGDQDAFAVDQTVVVVEIWNDATRTRCGGEEPIRPDRPQEPRLPSRPPQHQEPMAMCDQQQQHDLEQATWFAALQREREEADRIWALCKTDPHLASPGSKYGPRYNLAVDQQHGDRALEIKMLSCRRPHMRALHCAWISFFLAFVIWVAPSPLLREIQTTLHLSKQDVWTSSIANDGTAILTRMLIGPICDAYGARLPMAIVLVAASIPTALLGLVQSATGLTVCRFFIGIAGSSFGTFLVFDFAGLPCRSCFCPPRLSSIWFHPWVC
jgi:hypothetical protein